jgi:hypothetical protein
MRMYGAPSPRILIFARQDVLSLRRCAASFGVSITGIIVEGFSDGVRVSRGGREFILRVSSCALWMPATHTSDQKGDLPLERFDPTDTVMSKNYIANTASYCCSSGESAPEIPEGVLR